MIHCPQNANRVLEQPMSKHSRGIRVVGVLLAEVPEGGAHRAAPYPVGDLGQRRGIAAKASELGSGLAQ